MGGEGGEAVTVGVKVVEEEGIWRTGIFHIGCLLQRQKERP